MPNLDTINTTTPLIGTSRPTPRSMGSTRVNRRYSPSPSRAAVSMRFSTGPTNGPCSWRPTASSHRSRPACSSPGTARGSIFPSSRLELGSSVCLLVSSPGTTHRSPGATIRCRVSRAECGAGGIDSATSMAFRRIGPTSAEPPNLVWAQSSLRNSSGSNPSSRPSPHP